MESERLDNMPMDDVLRLARVKGDGEYWLRVARVKLAEYRRLMPRLEMFCGPDWRGRADAWQAQIDAIDR